MALGPVDVYIISFPENRFSGEVVPAITKQVNAGVIRIMDVLFVSKDADGVVTTLAAQDIGPEGAAFAQLDLIHPGSLNSEDADEVGDDLPINSSALLIAYENSWMQEVAGAFSRAGAVVLDQIRIPADVVNPRLYSALLSEAEEGDLPGDPDRAERLGWDPLRPVDLHPSNAAFIPV